MYIFAGGGSGGHLYPGIAVAEALQQMEPAAEILFLCSSREIDKEILSKGGWDFIAQPILPLPRRPAQLWRFWRSWRKSITLCKQVIYENKAQAVLGMGGYACAAAMEVAFGREIPVAMLNPDVIPGFANRFCGKFAEVIFLQWQESLSKFGKYRNRCRVSGCPIRQEFDQLIPPDRAKTQLGLDSDRRLLLVMGGSQGGRNVNRAVIKCLTQMPKHTWQSWQIVHISGKNHYDWVVEGYRGQGISADVRAYSHEMPKMLMAADLVISRAGSSSLAELTAVRLPSILLPYPYHRDQHQLKNAQVLEWAGSGRIVIDDCNEDDTAASLKPVLQDCMREETLLRMAKATEKLAKPASARVVAEFMLDAADRANSL